MCVEARRPQTVMTLAALTRHLGRHGLHNRRGLPHRFWRRETPDGGLAGLVSIEASPPGLQRAAFSGPHPQDPTELSAPAHRPISK